MTITNQADKIQAQFNESDVNNNTFIFNNILTSDDADYLKAYLRNYLLPQCSTLPLNALAPDDRQREQLNLQSVYVNLDCDRRMAFRPSEPGRTEVHPTTRAALAHVIASPRLVILGDPGAGKSTLLRFMATCLAQAWLDPEGAALTLLNWRYEADEQEESYEVSWPHGLYMPLFFVLRDLGPQLPAQPTKATLWEFMRANLERDSLTKAIEPLEKLLLEGKVLLLFDGVDELARSKRPAVWQAIGLMQELFPLCPWVATCRILGFEESAAKPANISRQVTLKPFNRDQMAAFIRHWYQALVQVGEKTAPQAEADSQHLIDLTADKHLSELAENPMLLTIMAMVHSFDGTLPREEAKLYKRCIDNLVVRWQRHKESRGQGGEWASLEKLGVTQGEILTILQTLAWQAHHKQNEGLIEATSEVADLSYQKVRDVAKAVFPPAAGGRPDEPKIAQFMEYTETRAHVLVGRGDDRYTFPHRKFQEFLAARYLISQGDWGEIAIPLAEQGDAWREVLLLAVGNLIFNNETGAPISDDLVFALNDLLCGDPAEERLVAGQAPHWWRVWRVGEMVALVGWERLQEKKRAQKLKLWSRTQQALVQLVSQGELTAPERVKAARVLSELGDPRPGVTVGRSSARPLPDFAWQEIPAGKFMMGEGDKAYEVELPTYYMSRYPVTNAQFGAFIAAGGYQAPAYWTQAGWQWREKEDRTEPRYWHSSGFNQANQPVVGVSWYEALAFCQWAATVLQQAIRLPTEAEWEKAARGPDGRTYPWGKEISSEHANYGGEIGATSAVGCYPRGRSPYGVEDMAGNVWEWTVSGYQDYPYRNDDRNDVNKNVSRVLRGGSWNIITNFVRTAYRGRLNPTNTDYNIGFRCLRSP